MSAGIIKDLLDKMPPWFYQVAGVVVLVALAYFFWMSFSVVRNLKSAISNVLGRDDRIKDLQEKLDAEKEVSRQSKTVSSQLSTALFNIRPYVETLNNIRTELDHELRMQEATGLMQRILDQLSSDIKFRAGERHRCGIWINEERILKLSFVSAGFPCNYRNFRTLDVDNSTAGKSFRKKQTLRIPDVSKDSDWEANPESKSDYKSIICIPLGAWGVLTIDGLEELSEECEMIAELYATIIEGSVQEHEHSFYLRNYAQSLEINEDVV